jgi:hypothetical protein
MKRFAVLLLVIGLFLAGCTQARQSIVQPALNEDVAWTTMLSDWSVKAYASKDFRAGMTKAALDPFLSQMPAGLVIIVQNLAAFGDQKTPEYQAGLFGGNIIAAWALTLGQGYRWVLGQLSNLGVLAPLVGL